MNDTTRLTLAVLAACCLTAGNALAQGAPAPTGGAAPATGAAPAAATPAAGTAGTAAAPAAGGDAYATVNKPGCKRPEFPGRLASDLQKRAFNKDIEGYAECIKQYVAEQQKQADAHIKAANQAAVDYNSTVKELQAEIDAAKE